MSSASAVFCDTPSQSRVGLPRHPRSRIVLVMNRRTSPQKKMDEAAFPVRLRIVVPPHGLGPLLDTMHQWLRADIGTGNFASHSSAGLGCQGMAIYFRTVADARRFTDAFPQVALADGIKAVSYSSPYRSPSR